METFALTHPGYKRKHNEDHSFIKEFSDNRCLLAVCTHTALWTLIMRPRHKSKNNRVVTAKVIDLFFRSSDRCPRLVPDLLDGDNVEACDGMPQGFHDGRLPGLGDPQTPEC